MIKLSVVIPCYNKADYLIEMIECIKKQTFTDWELIMVDDGSDEYNFDKVHEFVKSDSRICHVRRNRLPKNGDTCRNVGIDAAKGEYLIIFDADDIITESCFEKRVGFMESHPDCDYASFPSMSFVDGTDVLKPRSFNTDENDILEAILSANYPFTVWGNIYRRSSVDNIRWDERLYIYQDFDFMLQCVFANLKHERAVGYDPDYYYRLFTNGNSVCSKVVSPEKTKSTLYLFEKTLNKIELQADPKRLKDCFIRFILIQFEQLLLSAKNKDVEELINIVEKYYPDEARKMKSLRRNRKDPPYSHWQLFKLYYRLYRAFKLKVYFTFMTHEFVKSIIKR